MPEYRVSLGSLAALAVTSCVLGMNAPAQASQQGFIGLPQVLAYCCPKALANVPSVHEADRAHLITEFSTVQGGPLAQGDVEGTQYANAGLAFFPGQGGAWVSSRQTTRYSVSELAMADRAAGAGSKSSAVASGEAVDGLILASAAPVFWAQDWPAKKPAIFAHDGDRLASGTSDGSGTQTQPSAEDGGQTGGDTNEKGSGGDSGSDSGESPVPEFTGSASPSGPSLDNAEEKALILNGWK